MRDLVPQDLRRDWTRRGWYPERDSYRLFEDWVAKDPDRPAVADDRGTVTYGELAAKARLVAARLSGAGIGAGDIVGIQVPNVHQACAVDLAVAAVGAVCLPYPVLYREREVRSRLGRARASARRAAGSGAPSSTATAAPTAPRARPPSTTRPSGWRRPWGGRTRR